VEDVPVLSRLAGSHLTLIKTFYLKNHSL
jgi:hypothetical protein